MKKLNLLKERDAVKDKKFHAIEISPKFKEKWYDIEEQKILVKDQIVFALARLSEAKKDLDRDKNYDLIRNKINLAYRTLGNTVGRMSD